MIKTASSKLQPLHKISFEEEFLRKIFVQEQKSSPNFSGYKNTQVSRFFFNDFFGRGRKKKQFLNIFFLGVEFYVEQVQSVIVVVVVVVGVFIVVVVVVVVVAATIVVAVVIVVVVVVAVIDVVVDLVL